MEFPKYDMESELRRFRPLVTATARRYAGRGADFDDLVQEGYLALLELIKQQRVRASQERPFGEIYLQMRVPDPGLEPEIETIYED